MELSKVHFLVHPGWREAAMRIRGGDLDPGRRQELIREDKLLFRRYLDKIKSIKGSEDEALVLIAPPRFPGLKEDAKTKKSYIDFTHKAKDILGPRCIVMSSPTFLPASDEPKSDEDTYIGYQGDLETSRDQLLKNLKTRNLQITPDTQPEVWGQSLSKCVPRTCFWIEKYLPFNKTPVVPVQSTDLKRFDPDTIREYDTDFRAEKTKAQRLNRT